MTSETVGSWLGTLAALWNADGLVAWTAKLIAVLVAVFVFSAVFSMGFGRGSAGKRASSPPSRTRMAAAAPARPRARVRVVPPKNRKKKPDRIVRRYRPRSHAGALRPLTRRAALKLVDKDKPVLMPRPVQPTQPAPRRQAV
jgi:hypothetical protein